MGWTQKLNTSSLPTSFLQMITATNSAITNGEYGTCKTSPSSSVSLLTCIEGIPAYTLLGGNRALNSRLDYYYKTICTFLPANEHLSDVCVTYVKWMRHEGAVKKNSVECDLNMYFCLKLNVFVLHFCMLFNVCMTRTYTTIYNCKCGVMWRFYPVYRAKCVWRDNEGAAF